MDLRILIKPYEYEVRLWGVNKRTGEKTFDPDKLYTVVFNGESKLVPTDSFRFMNITQLTLSELCEMLKGTENIREIIGNFKF